jgi:hypothetical protein
MSIDKRLTREDALERINFLARYQELLEEASKAGFGNLTAEEILEIHKELAIWTTSFFEDPDVWNARKRNPEILAGETDVNPTTEEPQGPQEPDYGLNKDPQFGPKVVRNDREKLRERQQNPNYGTVTSTRHSMYRRKVLGSENSVILKQFYQSWTVLLIRVQKAIIEKQKLPTRELKLFLRTFPSDSSQEKTPDSSHQGTTQMISRAETRLRRQNRRLGYAIRMAFKGQSKNKNRKSRQRSNRRNKKK